jgi:rhodanese-related sulfurtransferase
MLFSRSKSLTPSDAAAALARGELQLIDVREPSEVSEARVKGARHIPLGQLPAKLGELDRERPVAFLCRSGSRSAIATRTATKAGLDAANVKGGVVGWERAGLPQIWIRTKDREEVVEFEAVNTFAAEVDDLAGAILDGSEPRVGAADALSNMRILDRLAEAARN